MTFLRRLVPAYRYSSQKLHYHVKWRSHKRALLLRFNLLTRSRSSRILPGMMPAMGHAMLNAKRGA